MIQETLRAPELKISGLLLSLVLVGAPHPLPAQDADVGELTDVEETSALAEDFLRAFAARDFERVRAILAPEARIQWAWLGGEAPQIESFEVDEWLARVTESTAPLDDFQVEILGSNALAFDDGVSVSVRFRMLGAVGGGRFVNDGVDTLSFAQIEGQWRIVLSNSIEKLVFLRPEP